MSVPDPKNVTPADIIAGVTKTIQELEVGANAALSGFVEAADASYVDLGEMNVSLDAIGKEMDMLDSDTPPKGAEKFVALLNEDETDVDATMEGAK